MLVLKCKNKFKKGPKKFLLSLKYLQILHSKPPDLEHLRDMDHTQSMFSLRSLQDYNKLQHELSKDCDDTNLCFNRGTPETSDQPPIPRPLWVGGGSHGGCDRKMVNVGRKDLLEVESGQ